MWTWAALMSPVCFVSSFSRAKFLFCLRFTLIFLLLGLLSELKAWIRLLMLRETFLFVSNLAIGHLFKGIRLICAVTLYSPSALPLPDGQVLSTQLLCVSRPKMSSVWVRKRREKDRLAVKAVQSARWISFHRYHVWLSLSFTPTFLNVRVPHCKTLSARSRARNYENAHPFMLRNALK